MMELHAILEHRKKVGYNTPSFIKWVNTSAEENVKIFFINEIRLYNETDSAPILAKQINARSTEIRGEAIRTLGKLKYKEIEPKLIEMYHVQPEEVKRQIKMCIRDRPFSRAPQIRYRYTNKNFQLTGAAVWQSQYTSQGPEGKTHKYLKQSCIPEFYVGADYKNGGLLAGVGIELLSLKPRTESIVNTDKYKVEMCIRDSV